VSFRGTAVAADAAAFPLNTPTVVTNLPGANLLGATGTLLANLTTYFGEGGTIAIFNRVEDSETPATLQANLIGDAVARTGF
jgi:phage tail sheath protein FI